MKRTYGHMISSLQRRLWPVRVPLGEILQALQTAAKDLDAKYEWPWSYGEANISIRPPYSTGTVTVNPNSTLVAGTGTDFSTPGIVAGIVGERHSGWRLRINGRTSDWLIAYSAGVTDIDPVLVNLVLEQEPNVDASLIDQSYMVFKDEYAMPSDFQPGSQLLLCHQESRLPITYRPVSTVAEMAASFRGSSASAPVAYSDCGRNRIRFTPTLLTRMELKLIYKRVVPDFAATSDTTYLPEGYDELVELVAEAKLRMENGMPDANATGRAATKFGALKRQISTSQMLVDGTSGSGMADSSISDRGLFILPLEE